MLPGKTRSAHARIIRIGSEVDGRGQLEGAMLCLFKSLLESNLCLLFIHPPAHGSEVSPAARNTLDSARIPRASKLLICGLFQKGRVLAQDGDDLGPKRGVDEAGGKKPH